MSPSISPSRPAQEPTPPPTPGPGGQAALPATRPINEPCPTAEGQGSCRAPTTPARRANPPPVVAPLTPESPVIVSHPRARGDVGTLTAALVSRREPAARTSALPTRVSDGVYLGDRAVAENREGLRQLGITHVVSVTRQPLEVTPLVELLQLRISDIPEERLRPEIDRALPFIESALNAGGRVLIHCEQAISRSVSVTLAYLMRARGMSLDGALSALKAVHGIAEPNPGFLRQLRDFERTSRPRASSARPSSEVIAERIVDLAGAHRVEGPVEEALARIPSVAEAERGPILEQALGMAAKAWARRGEEAAAARGVVRAMGALLENQWCRPTEVVEALQRAQSANFEDAPLGRQLLEHVEAGIERIMPLDLPPELAPARDSALEERGIFIAVRSWSGDQFRVSTLDQHRGLGPPPKSEEVEYFLYLPERTTALRLEAGSSTSPLADRSLLLRALADPKLRAEVRRRERFDVCCRWALGGNPHDRFLAGVMFSAGVGGSRDAELGRELSQKALENLDSHEACWAHAFAHALRFRNHELLTTLSEAWRAATDKPRASEVADRVQLHLLLAEDSDLFPIEHLKACGFLDASRAQAAVERAAQKNQLGVMRVLRQQFDLEPPRRPGPFAARLLAAGSGTLAEKLYAQPEVI